MYLEQTTSKGLSGNDNFDFSKIPEMITKVYVESLKRWDKKSLKISEKSIFEIPGLRLVHASELCLLDDSFEDVIEQFTIRYNLLTALPAKNRTLHPVPLGELLRLAKTMNLQFLNYYSGLCDMKNPFARVAIALYDDVTESIYILCEYRNAGKDRVKNESFYVRSFVFDEDLFRLKSRANVQLEYFRSHNNRLGELHIQDFKDLINSNRNYCRSLDNYNLSFLEQGLERSPQEIKMFKNVFGSRLEDSNDSYQLYTEDFKQTYAWKNRADNPERCMMTLRDVYRTGKVLGYDDKTKRPKFSRTLFKGVKIIHKNLFDHSNWNENFLKQIAFLKKKK